MSRLREEIAALDRERDRCMTRAIALEASLPSSEEAESYRAQARHAKASADLALKPWLAIGQWVRAHTLDGVVVGEGKIIARDPVADRFTVHFSERGGTDVFGADALRTIDRPRRRKAR